MITEDGQPDKFLNFYYSPPRYYMAKKKFKPK